VHAPVHSASTKRECLGTRGAYAQANDNLCKCVANGRLATSPLRQATGDISTTTTYGSKKRPSLTCLTAAAAVMMLLHTLHTASGLSNECQGTMTFTPQHELHTAFKQAGQRCRHRISENLDAHVGTQHWGTDLMSTSMGPSGAAPTYTSSTTPQQQQTNRQTACSQISIRDCVDPLLDNLKSTYPCQVRANKPREARW
jgi:hypothetical protein